MARKKVAAAKTGRTDPLKNKSLAIRLTLKTMPAAKAADVAAAVKKDYGHVVGHNQIYMVKTKTNMATDGRVREKTAGNGSPMVTSALWVEAIKQARQLLKCTGSVANATALLKALDS